LSIREFARLVQVMGTPWVCMLKGYFDESGTDKARKQDFPCVAGFLFSSENALLFSQRWEEEIRPKLPTEVEAFHASECFHGGKKSRYRGKSEAERMAIFDAMIALTNDTASHGVVVGVDATEYENEMKRQPKFRPMLGSPYSICALRCAHLIGDWLDTQGTTGDVPYYFEHGDHNKVELHEFFFLGEKQAEIKKRMRYGGHSFPKKGTAHPLEAADLLAWAWHRCYCTGVFEDREPPEWEGMIKKFTVKVQPEQITATGLGINAMVNAFYGLHSTRRGKPLTKGRVEKPSAGGSGVWNDEIASAQKSRASQ